MFQFLVCGAVSLDTVTVPYPEHAHEKGQLIRFWADNTVANLKSRGFNISLYVLFPR